MSATGRRCPRGLMLLVSLSFACAVCPPRADKANDDTALANDGTTTEAKRNGLMEPKIDRQCDFSKVERTLESYPCTPVLTREHEDVIWINAPEEVTFTPHGDEPLGEDTRFIICGAIQMRTETLADLGIHGNTMDVLMLVAVDAKTNRTYRGTIGHLGTRIPMPKELQKPPVPGYLIGHSFNPNLVTSFDMPAVETDYYVHALLGPFKSNVLKVRLRRRK